MAAVMSLAKLCALNGPLEHVRGSECSLSMTFASLGTSPLCWSTVPELHRATMVVGGYAIVL